MKTIDKIMNEVKECYFLGDIYVNVYKDHYQFKCDSIEDLKDVLKKFEIQSYSILEDAGYNKPHIKKIINTHDVRITIVDSTAITQQLKCDLAKIGINGEYNLKKIEDCLTFVEIENHHIETLKDIHHYAILSYCEKLVEDMREEYSEEEIYSYIVQENSILDDFLEVSIKDNYITIKYFDEIVVEIEPEIKYKIKKRP